jgi:uncharacterized radical SAM protein YgiQ
MSQFSFPSLAFRKEVYKSPAHNENNYDVVLITGDAFVDHPAFPAAVVCRALEKLGCSVAVIAQPDWKNPEDFKVWGKPRKFFAVAPGAMDSMVANFTATRMPRSNDRLSPGGKPGLRPKRAVQVYTQMIRRLFSGVPVVIGGIEASLRRFVHYDFWEDKLRDPVLMNAPADFLVYGMAESVLPEIVEHYSGGSVNKPVSIAQTCIRVKHNSWKDWLKQEPLILPSVEECKKNADSFLKMSLILDKSVRPEGRVLIQQHVKGDIICFPPDKSTYSREITIFDQLNFNRSAHPLYKDKISALEPVQFSIQSHRGCVGACSFCALALHQGRFIRSRDAEVLIEEAKSFLRHPDFKGVINDVGGPSVNMYGWKCRNDGCKENLCAANKLCRSMSAGLDQMAELLEKIAAIKGIKHVFIGSGLRYDLIKDKDWPAFKKIIGKHISGQLKVAPEHFDKKVLQLMRKGADSNFASFAAKFYRFCNELNKKIYLVPYLITAFPGSDDRDDVLVKKVKELRLVHEQIQEFTPTPGSLASAMYYVGKDFNFQKIRVAKSRKRRLETRKKLQHKKKRPPKKK